VIELGIQPVIRAVALVASDAKLRCNVFWIRRRFEIRGMARVAVCRCGLEPAVGGALVAGTTIDGRMRASQRKAIVVLLHLLDRNHPSAHGMALFAVCAQLPLVNVRVAVLATQSHVLEHRLQVALGAGHGLVHTAQWILGLVVIEFWKGSNRPPCVVGVAVLARHIEVAMRTVRACAGRLSQSWRDARESQHQHRCQLELSPQRQHVCALSRTIA